MTKGKGKGYKDMALHSAEFDNYNEQAGRAIAAPTSTPPASPAAAATQPSASPRPSSASPRSTSAARPSPSTAGPRAMETCPQQVRKWETELAEECGKDTPDSGVISRLIRSISLAGHGTG